MIENLIKTFQTILEPILIQLSYIFQILGSFTLFFLLFPLIIFDPLFEGDFSHETIFNTVMNIDQNFGIILGIATLALMMIWMNSMHGGSIELRVMNDEKKLDYKQIHYSFTTRLSSNFDCQLDRDSHDKNEEALICFDCSRITTKKNYLSGKEQGVIGCAFCRSTILHETNSDIKIKLDKDDKEGITKLTKFLELNNFKYTTTQDFPSQYPKNNWEIVEFKPEETKDIDCVIDRKGILDADLRKEVK